MADYKGIKGFTIQSLSADPPAPIVGQVWYNTTSTVLKGYVSGDGAWSSGGTLNIARGEFAGARAGTVTAGLVFGGDGPPSTTPPGYMDHTEKYDGSAWTEVNNLNNVRASPGSLGTQTAAMCISGNNPAPPNPNYDEVYNGTSWTEVNETNTRRVNPGGAGTTTAGVIAGGDNTTICETWDGTSWTETNNLLTARAQSGFAGIVETAALVCGGNPGYKDITETWNGTSWTETNQMQTASAQYVASFGSQTAALAVGGITASPNVYSTKTEIWNGSSWTETGDITTAARLGAGGGSSSAGIACGGIITPGYSQATEEWADPVLTTKTFTSS
jgi:hypothetical protein